MKLCRQYRACALSSSSTRRSTTPLVSPSPSFRSSSTPSKVNVFPQRLSNLSAHCLTNESSWSLYQLSLPLHGSDRLLLVDTRALQAIRWMPSGGRHFHDYHCPKNLLRHESPNSMQRSFLRAMCTIQGTKDSVDVENVPESYKGHQRCAREDQHAEGHFRDFLESQPQEHDNKFNTDAEESIKSMEIQYDEMKAALGQEDPSGSQTDDVEGESDSIEDESDIDSNSDNATVITANDILSGVRKQPLDNLSEKTKKKEIRKMMDQLVNAALDEADEPERGTVPESEQRSVRVGIIGAVNSGKSTLTNLMVGTKVAAVSRKRNTTVSEILGIVTNGRTQILLYDTPGLVLDILGTPSKTDARRRSESAWQLFSHCEVLLVLVDAYRQIHKPDKRVLRLIEKLGAKETSRMKKSLVLNKVDIIENKRLLLPLAQEFGKLPGYENIFMVSALTGSGVRDIATYLTNQAILRPWEEEPGPLNEETIRTLSMEIVREHLLDRVHEEIPYELDQQLVDWQELEDGSLRVEQHFYLPKKGQCRIVVGRGGSKIREIGIKACEELRTLLNRKVHLFLEVKHG